MADLVAFITARLDEDESDGRNAEADWKPTAPTLPRGTHLVYGLERVGFGIDYQIFAGAWEPARVLCEIAAKRLMLADHQAGISRHYNCRNRDHIQEWQCERASCPFEESRYCEICPDSDYLGTCRGVRLLAAPYADHPDYQQEWAP